MADPSTPRKPVSGVHALQFIWLAALTVGVVAVHMRGGDMPGSMRARGAQGVSPGALEEITFTPEGFEQPVVRLTGAMPDPQVAGQTFPRSNVVAGLQFMDADGNELGGWARSQKVGGP